MCSTILFGSGYLEASHFADSCTAAEAENYILGRCRRAGLRSTRSCPRGPEPPLVDEFGWLLPVWLFRAGVDHFYHLLILRHPVVIKYQQPNSVARSVRLSADQSQFCDALASGAGRPPYSIGRWM
jgi:hypothetical protein